MDLWSSGGKLLFTYNPVTRLGKIVKSGMDLALINYQNNTYAGIADSRNDRTYDTADINFDTMTISNIVTNTGYTGLTNVGPIGHSDYDGYLVFDYDATDLLFCIYVYDKNNVRVSTVLYTTDTTGSLTTTSIVSGKKHDVMKNHYVTAPTQLSAIAEYVYGKEFYGKNGVETGTLQNKENLTKDEVKRRVDIWANYSSGIVCPDDVSEMFYGCTNLTTIPLLDTSSVTTMYAMFQGCTNLTTIPELDTSNVTIMQNTFNYCPNLSDESLNNILAMCTNATSYTRTKTLKYIGLTSEQANKCKTLSNYSAFTSAGWTIGY